MLLEKLSLVTHRSHKELMDFGRSAGRRYKVFAIPKRSGGVRIIEQPSRSVKSLQKWLEKALFYHFPIHESAMGYRKGISIKENALSHANCSYTLRMDFRDFFWSFTKESIISFFRENSGLVGELSSDDLAFIGSLVTRNDRLVMGAPSSPTLTNIMMHPLDEKINAIAMSFGGVYTRYADDLFISTNDTGASYKIADEICLIVNGWRLPTLTINAEKTTYLSKKSRRIVTGLFITSDGSVSIGRDRKRMIKSLVHDARIGNLDNQRISELSGYLNWSRSAEPSFFTSLQRKYGEDTIEMLSNPNKHVQKI